MLHRKIKWKWQELKRMMSERLGETDWSDIEATFIISTGRTGTAFLAKFFRDNFRGVDARHEPRPDMFDLGISYLLKKTSFSDAVTQFRHHRRYICYEVHKGKNDHYIECNNNLSYLIPVIQELYGDRRFVYIIRDGRDFVRSVYSRTAVKNGQHVLVMTDDDPRRRLAATDFEGDAYRDKWGDMSRVERISWYWVKVNQIILDSLKNETNALTIKFEDIFDKAKGYEGMWKIIEYLRLMDRLRVSQEDLEMRMEERMNRNREYALGAWIDWSDEHKEQFAEIAGELMERFGYCTARGRF